MDGADSPTRPTRLPRRQRARRAAAPRVSCTQTCSHAIAQRKRQSPPAPPSQPLASARRAPDQTVTTRRRRSSSRQSGAGSVVPPRSRQRDARPPLFRCGGSLCQRGASRSAARASACGRWRGRVLSGGGRRRAALTAPLPAAPRWRSWRRLSRAAALAAARRSAAALPWRRLALSAGFVVLSGSRSLRVVIGAVASSLGAVDVARRSRRRCLRRVTC